MKRIYPSVPADPFGIGGRAVPMVGTRGWRESFRSAIDPALPA